MRTVKKQRMPLSKPRIRANHPDTQTHIHTHTQQKMDNTKQQPAPDAEPECELRYSAPDSRKRLENPTVLQRKLPAAKAQSRLEGASEAEAVKGTALEADFRVQDVGFGDLGLEFKV